MRRLPLIIVVAAGAAVVGTAIASETKLRGSVGPGFSISLRDASGASVSGGTLAAGTYEIEVEDKADSHNFHLTGPGVDVATGVDEVESKTFTVTLQDGQYTFVCDPHAASMKGSFRVGAATGGSGGSGGSGSGGSTSGGSATRPSAPVGSKLVLTSGPGFTIGLRTTTGKKVTRLRPGTYTILVRDRSGAHNARIAGAGAARATTVPFVGTKTWRVVLKKGKLVFQCDPHASSMRGSVIVA
jgi:plastocyanin